MLNKIMKNLGSFRKVLSNSSWIIWQNVIMMVIGLFVTSITARYLGPSNFGLFNYALSFVFLFTAFSTLGMESLTVKALVDKKYEEQTVLWTSFVLRTLGGVFLTFVAYILILFLEPKDITLHLMIFILSVSMIFRSFEVIEYWLQAHLQAKISSLIRVGANIIISLLKILVVLLHASIIMYTLVYLVETIIVGIALIVYYLWRSTKKWSFSFSTTYARELFLQGWYIALASLMVNLYIRLDQVMIGSMLVDKTELGMYSAAIRVAEMWYFVPLSVITSLRPIIMNYKNSDEKTYNFLLQLLYTIVAWIGIFFGLIITLLSNDIIYVLYGPSYLEAAKILSISVWGGTFAIFGSARSIWLLSENLQRFTPYYTLGGLIVNIFLNVLLIPKLGAYGAAIATLISHFIANIVVFLFFKKTRASSIAILRSFTLGVIWDYFKLRKKVVGLDQGEGQG